MKKAFFTSLAAGVVLCAIALVRSGFAQANYLCSGAFEGCTLQQCVLGGINCPPGGANGGMACPYATFTPVSIYSCVPAGPGCNPNFVNNSYCSVVCYSGLDVHFNCTGILCDFSEKVGQCQNPP
jgi:hypothetical protein